MGKKQHLDWTAKSIMSTGSERVSLLSKEVSGKSSDLSGLFAHADANNQRTGVGGNKDVGNSSYTFLGVKPMDMHRPNLDMRFGVEYALSRTVTNQLITMQQKSNQGMYCLM